MVSVVVPVFRVEKYLDRCMNSLLHQTYQDFEIILVDDGSDDSCPQICDQYVNAYKNVYVIHQRNQGLSAARNVGIQAAKGEYIAFIDSDDWVHEEYLNILVKNIADAAQCCCGVKTVSEYVQEPFTQAKEVYCCTGMQALKRNECRIYACGRIYRRAYIDDVRFNKDLINSSEDRAFNAELLAKHPNEKIVIVPNQLYYYFQRSGTLSNSDMFSDLPSIGKMIAIAEETNCDMLLEYLIEWLCGKRRSGYHIGMPPDFETVEAYLKICEEKMDVIIPHALRRLQYKIMIRYPVLYSYGMRPKHLAARIVKKVKAYVRK